MDRATSRVRQRRLSADPALVHHLWHVPPGQTLCLLPTLQLCVWRALGRDNFEGVGCEAGRNVAGLVEECVKTACNTINMFERHTAV